MKTRSLIAVLFILLAIAYCSNAATVIVKISQFPNATSPSATDLFLLASGSTNKNITWNQLKDAIGTNPATVTVLNNVYISNLFTTNIYASNAYFTNVTVVNELRGKTSFITNLYTTQIITNYYLFSTNLYLSYPTYINNSYVSNYFQTNAFNNTYVSNYFTTNSFNYFTNLYHYSTNLTVTNFYLTDNYISNFFNTNIFLVDNTVSNFFATNIYNTINISSNYTYQYDMNLTNPVFYGTVWIDGYTGNPDPILHILSPNGYDIVLNGGTGEVNASIYSGDSYLHFDVPWDGPTNNIDCESGSQYYTATSDCSITNLSLLPIAGRSFGGLLVITNSAATNITLRVPSTIIMSDGASAFTITNGTAGMLSFRYSSITGTNGVFRRFPDGITTTRGLYYSTNSWSGPTNVLPLHLARQWYATYTPVSVTGYTQKSNTVTESVLLTITNAASTNVLLTLAAGTMTGNYTNQYTVSNASTAKIWFEYDPGPGDTNAVFRQMK